MENCNLVLHFPEYGSETMMEVTRVGSSMIDVWPLALYDKVDLRRRSYRCLPRRIDKVGLVHADVQCDGAAVEFRVRVGD